MAAFGLGSCARRLLRLARQAGQSPPAESLTAVANRVLVLEAELLSLQWSPGAGDDGRE